MQSGPAASQGLRSVLWALVVLVLAHSAQAKPPQYSEELPADARLAPLRTHTLQLPYLDDSLLSRWFDYGGDTVVRTDKYVRLTADRPGQAGWIFSRLPLTAPNFQIEFEFKISGKGNLYGDGMAMWLTRQRATAGTVFGGPDYFDGLGLFIDTYKNNRPGVAFPYVMLMSGNGQTRYSNEDDGKANEINGCSARGLHNAQFNSRARFTYVKDRFVKLELMYREEGKWVECFTVPNVALPNAPYLGFSAATGELSENHDLVSVDVSTVYMPAGGAGGPQPGGNVAAPAARSPKPRSSFLGWLWYLTKLGLGIGACFFGYLKYKEYKAKQRSNDVFF
ncbi:concanavalin A-like lectin/glucanase domain-containing protein [Dipodascopsis tothii]|uniref:concanavalin A-like lectin/glucanase domain-containing protein n=1 Tax=Dipodascopsis tothii TaxID=44089 RepID=UPI0034CD2015